MSFDPRITPARPDLAAAHLRGRIDAPRYADGHRMTVAAPVLDLTATPDRDVPLASQLVMGEVFTVYAQDADTGMAWGQSDTDGYVGYVSLAGLDPDATPPTMQVTAITSHLYPEPNLKTRPLEALPQFARLITDGVTGEFIAVHGGGYCPAQHVGVLGAMATDPVTVAKGYLGVPYLWGGRSAFGLDCSALVQLSYAATGRDLPRDSDMQAKAGTPVEGALQRGDLVFWKGHVGMMCDDKTLLHANARHMAVVAEPLAEATRRIAAAGEGDITARRRL